MADFSSPSPLPRQLWTRSRVSFAAAVHAEWLRSWRSFTMWMPLVVIGIAVISRLLSFGVIATPLSSAHFYGVGIVVPLGVLMGVAGQKRDANLRQGGVIWRHTSLARTLLARAVVVAAYSIIAHAAMAVILSGASVPTTRLILLVVISVVTFMTMWIIGVLLWAMIGGAALFLGPIGGLAWCVAGVLSADSPQWVFLPWTWYFRPTLPVYGVLPNSVSAATTGPDSWVWDVAIGPPLLLQALLAVAVFAGVLALGRAASAQQMPGRHRPQAAQPSHSTPPSRRATQPRGDANVYATATASRSIVRGLASTLPWPTLLGLSVILIAIVVGVRALRGVEVASALASFVGIPAAATTTAVLIAGTQAEAWPSLMFRPLRNRIAVTLAGIGLSFVVPVVVVTVVTATALPDPAVVNGHRWFYQFFVCGFVAAMIFLVELVIAMRSITAAIAVAIAGLIWSILVGGSVLAESPLWWTAPLSWVEVARLFPERWVLIIGASLLISAVALVLMRNIRRVTAA